MLLFRSVYILRCSAGRSVLGSTGRRSGRAGRREEAKVKESTALVGGVRASKDEVVSYEQAAVIA